MGNQNYDALEAHFNSSDAFKLRGLVSEKRNLVY